MNKCDPISRFQLWSILFVVVLGVEPAAFGQSFGPPKLNGMFTNGSLTAFVDHDFFEFVSTSDAFYKKKAFLGPNIRCVGSSARKGDCQL